MHANPLKAPQTRAVEPPAEAAQAERKDALMSPPTFKLEAKAPEKEAAEKEAPRAAAPGKDPKPLKTHKDEVEYGPVKEGPIAEQGVGDSHAVAAKDVNQGELGDCYMLSALMAIAMQNPQHLRDAISGPKADGSYDVTLYRRKGRGKKKTFTAEQINVTSSFIVKKGQTNEAYANGGDTDAKGNEELWVKLIEKAYAKYHGSFDKIDGGWEENALEILTGENYTQHDFNGGLFGVGKMSDEDLKAAIIDALAAGKPVCCSTYRQAKLNKGDKKDGNSFAAMNDVVGLHAYAVVRADESSITVRNPWGSGASVEEPTMSWAQFRQYYSEFTTRD